MRVNENLCMNALALEGTETHLRRLQEACGHVVVAAGEYARKSSVSTLQALRVNLAELLMEVTIVEHSFSESLDLELGATVEDFAEYLMKLGEVPDVSE